MSNITRPVCSACGVTFWGHDGWNCGPQVYVKAGANLLLNLALLLKSCVSLDKWLSLSEIYFPLLQKEDALGELFAGVQCHFLNKTVDTVAWFTSCPLREAWAV